MDPKILGSLLLGPQKGSPSFGKPPHGLGGRGFLIDLFQNAGLNVGFLQSDTSDTSSNSTNGKMSISSTHLDVWDFGDSSSYIGSGPLNKP